MKWCGLTIVLTIFLLGAFAGCAAGAAWAEEPTADPTVPAEPAPAVDAATKTWALKWFRSHGRAFDRYAAAQHALHPDWHCFWSPTYFDPRDNEPASLRDWLDFGHQMKIETKRYRALKNKLVHRMEHPRGSGARRWLPLCHWAGWPESQDATIVKVIWKESNGLPLVVGPGPYYGLFQIWDQNAPSLSHEQLLRPLTNVRLALQLYHRHGWQPWPTAY